MDIICFCHRILIPLHTIRWVLKLISIPTSINKSAQTHMSYCAFLCRNCSVFTTHPSYYLNFFLILGSYNQSHASILRLLLVCHYVRVTLNTGLLRLRLAFLSIIVADAPVSSKIRTTLGFPVPNTSPATSVVL